MITRFRVEGNGPTRESVVDEISVVVSRIITTIGQWDGEWECTADVVTKSEEGYVGRMVLKFETEED